MRWLRYAAKAALIGIGSSLIVVVLAALPARAQEAAAKKYENADARQFLSQAEQIAAKITDKADQIEGLEEVAADKATAGDYEGARIMARALGTDKSKATILQAIAVAQAIAGDVEAGIATIGGIRAPTDKITAFCAIAKALTDAGRKPDALRALVETDKPMEKLDDKEGTHALYVIALEFARAGDPETTSKLAAILKGSPLLEEMSATLVTYAKAWNHDLKGARMKFAGVHNPLLQGLALSGFVEVQYQSGDKSAAQAAGKEMILAAQKTDSPTEELVFLAQLQNQYGDSSAAKETAALALEAALKKDGVSVGRVAYLQAQIGDVDGALKTLALIKKPEDQIDARQAIATAKAKAGDVPGSLAMTPADAGPYCQAEVLIGTARGILKSLQKPAKP